jgi:uncharacterized membrane protein YcaP (DUF421 family)
MSEFLFGNWQSIMRVLVIAPPAYIGLVAFLRISGKRTLSKMNAFDLVITVALGSTLATIVLSKDVSLVTGLTAFALLIGLQYAVATLQVHSAFFRRLVKSEPRLLVRHGQVLSGPMRDERVARDEVLAAMRSSGCANLDEIEALVLETDGTFAVIRSAPPGDRTALGVLHDRID